LLEAAPETLAILNLFEQMDASAPVPGEMLICQ
jgi:hypothetical protein